MSTAAVDETSGSSRKNLRPRLNSPENISYNLQTGRESLHTIIKNLYGEEMDRRIRRLEVIQKKKANLLCSLTFLSRCRDTGIIPRFLKIKRNFLTPQAHRIYNRLESGLLRERIHHTRRELALLDKDILSFHLQLSNEIERNIWDKLDRLIHNQTEVITISSSNRQKKKFSELVRTEPETSTAVDSSKFVINLTDRELTTDELAVLKKGGKFAIAPSTIPTEDIIANIESVTSRLTAEAASEIRIETARILQKAKKPVSNIPKKELSALKCLNMDKNILVLSADKGNATVVMQRDDYSTKIKELLDSGTYRKIKHDPTSKILKKTKELIKETQSINEDMKKKLHHSEALPPRLYGLPKIHKQNIPLRPIVSTIGSPTYKLAKYLTGLLQPYVGSTEHHVKNSKDFIEKLKKIQLKPGDLLVSFDIVSLFTMVPIKETLNHISQLFTEDITALFRHCLTTTYFQWDNSFYEQIDGMAMGSPLSPVTADFYMEKFEKTALETAPYKPAIWLRYVDDTFVVWSHGDELLEDFLNHINSIHPKIQFTMEKENNGELPFLDVLVSKEQNTLHHKVYRKTTHTDRYLHKNSNHHPSQKRGIIKTLMDRARNICEPQFLEEEEKHIEAALITNGYTRREIKRALRPNTSTRAKNRESQEQIATAFLPYVKGITDRISKILSQHRVKTVFKPTRKIQDLLKSAKDSRDPLASAGVYRIPCSCGKVYIGTTKRSAATRLKEHRRCCRNLQWEKSAVAEHVLNNLDHIVQYENTQLLAGTTHYSTRLQREAIEIHKHPLNFNRKEEGLKLNKIWFPALQNTKIKPFKQNNNTGTQHGQKRKRTLRSAPNLKAATYATQSKRRARAIQSADSNMRDPINRQLGSSRRTKKDNGPPLDTSVVEQLQRRTLRNRPRL